MLDWIVEGLRWIIWGITAAGFELMDICYDIVVKIASADFLSDNSVWQWYYIFMAFLGVLILLRSFSVFLKFSFDEEFREKVSGAHFINKFIAIALAVIFIPIMLGFASKASIWGINNISMVVGTQSDRPSTFVITSFMNTDNGKFTTDGKWETGKKVTYTLDDVDINAEGEGDDDYKFFNDVQDLFIICIVGFASAIMLIMNGIQIGKRMYSLVMKVIIAPLPVSSIIVPGDETFAMWRKMILSDYLLNYIQTIMIMIVMILAGSSVIQAAGVWAQILSFISGLLLLLSGIPELAKIVGGDTSQAGVLQQIASFRMATRGVGSGVKNFASKAGGALATGAAAGMYGIGRMTGGQSMQSMEKQKKDNDENGFMGGSQVNDNQQTGFNLDQTKDPNTGKNGSVNMNAGNQHTSVANQQHENVSSPFSQLLNQGNTTGIEGNTKSISPAIGNEMSNKKEPNPILSSKEGSKARQFSEAAKHMSGPVGFGARFASNTTSHLYQHSQNKLQNTRIYRTGSKIHDLGSKKEIGGK